jgi:hypothetical protein
MLSYADKKKIEDCGSLSDRRCEGEALKKKTEAQADMEAVVEFLGLSWNEKETVRILESTMQESYPDLSADALDMLKDVVHYGFVCGVYATHKKYRGPIVDYLSRIGKAAKDTIRH